MSCGNSKVDPQLQQDYHRLKSDEAKRKLTKPTDLKELNEQSWQLFLKKLNIYKYSQAFPKKGKKHITFVGQISSGKSALINALFKTKLKTGGGQCTDKQKDVCGNNDLVIWDTRGFCPQFNLQTQINAIAYAKSFDHIFICSNAPVKNLRKPIQVLNVLKVPFSFVRTNCDNIQQDQKPLKQELQTDRANLSKITSSHINIFATSKKGGFDNQKLFNFIISNFTNGNSQFTTYPADKMFNY